MQDHSSKQYDSELDALRSRVTQMGGLVENQISNAIKAFVQGDIGLMEQIVLNDHRVNGLEVSIDEDCAHIIARRQPAAGDLRVILAITKTVTDLERIGDEAAKIARMAKQIYERDRINMPRVAEVKHMADTGVAMLRNVLDAFVRMDAVAAAHIVREDQAVDNFFRGTLRQLITYMMEDPRTITTALDLLFIAKAIERVGDHAKNIAEYVIYVVKGKDVRHITIDQLEREAQSDRG